MLPHSDKLLSSFKKFRDKRAKQQSEERQTCFANSASMFAPRRNRQEDFLHNHVKNSGGEQKKRWMLEFSANKDLVDLLDHVPLHRYMYCFETYRKLAFKMMGWI
jgi:hypothetical protein